MAKVPASLGSFLVSFTLRNKERKTLEGLLPVPSFDLESVLLVGFCSQDGKESQRLESGRPCCVRMAGRTGGFVAGAGERRGLGAAQASCTGEDKARPTVRPSAVSVDVGKSCSGLLSKLPCEM